MEQQRDRMRPLLTWGAMLVGLGIMLLLAVSLAVWSLGQTGPAGPTAPGAVFNPFWQVITFLAWLLVIGGILLLSLWLARKLWPAISAPGGSVSDEAIHTAQLRYARGEISREEYERIREDLLRADQSRERPPGADLPGEGPRMAA